MKKIIFLSLVVLFGTLVYLKLKSKPDAPQGSPQVDALSASKDDPQMEQQADTNLVNQVTEVKSLEEISEQISVSPSALKNNSREPIEPTYSEETYDPEKIKQPGYREMVMRHLSLRELYASPLRNSEPFHQCLDMAKRLSTKPRELRTYAMHLHQLAWSYSELVKNRSTTQSEHPDEIKGQKNFHSYRLSDQFNMFFPHATKKDWETLTEITPEGMIPIPTRSIETGEQ